MYNVSMVHKNQITEEVLRQRALGIPAVRIASDLGIHRNTVNNIVKRNGGGRHERTASSSTTQQIEPHGSIILEEGTQNELPNN